MSRMTLLLGGIALAAGLLTGAQAEPVASKKAAAPKDVPPVATAAGLAGIFYVMDCTNEGYVNTGEVAEHAGTLFRRMDLDRSGMLSREEYVTFVHEYWTGIRNAYFDEMDPDGDDLANHIDYANHLERLISAADTNRDGDASWDEILVMRGETDKITKKPVANFQKVDVSKSGDAAPASTQVPQ